MTFETAELSHETGAPVEVYDFTCDTVTIGRYTSAEVDQVIGADTYLAVPGGMERGPVATTADEGRNSLTIRVANAHPIAYRVHHRPRTGVIGVTVRQYHRSDASDIKTIWFGRVLGAKRDRNTGARILQCEPRSVSQNRTGLRRLCSTNCMHQLYGPLCRLTQGDWGHATTIDAISGNLLTVDSVDTLPYAGGIVEYVDADGVTDVAFIEDATGTALTLDIALWGAAVSDNVTIYPGCDWTMATCEDIFGNGENYGGRLNLPDKNPVTQSAFT